VAYCQNVKLMNLQADIISSRQNCKLTKQQVDETSYCWYYKLVKLVWVQKTVSYKIAIWKNIKLGKWHVDERASWLIRTVTKWQVNKVTKLQVDKNSSLWNVRLAKWQVDVMASWHHFLALVKTLIFV
jgi:hypothetical protein